MNYLSVEGVVKVYGERAILNGVTFGIEQGQKAAIIGVNGSGKSTLFNIIAGKDAADEGEVVFNNEVTVGYLNQNPQFDANHSVADAIFTSDHESLRIIRDYEAEILKAATGRSDEKNFSLLLEKMDALQLWDYEAKIKQILGKLGVYDLAQKTGTMSGGQKKRVALAKVLIEDPDFLILDEPTNHLDLDTIEWLESYLSTQNKTLLMVTHDRYFLESVTNEIFELHQGGIFGYKGSYSYYLEKKAEREELKQQEVEKAQNLMRKELDWIRRQPKARGTKAKYRIEAFEELKEKATREVADKTLKLQSNAQRLGKKIYEINHLDKAYGDKVIIKDFSYTFKRPDRIGIIGKNGTGKTTLLNLLTGRISPDNGELDKGLNTQFGYYTQQEMVFDDSKKVIEVISDIADVVKTPDGSSMTASQMLTYFKFPPAVQYNYVERLSGGEKRRLQLLTILIRNPNFLILDEPTNDLDLITLNVLEDYLLQFPGCLIVVTHDRYFMDRLVDHLFVFEGEGVIRDFPGNYTDYREFLKENEGPNERLSDKKTQESVKPKRDPEAKKKLSFKEKQEFRDLEQAIDQLEKKKAEIIEKMNAGSSQHEDLLKWSQELEQIQSSLDQKSDRWLELSELM